MYQPTFPNQWIPGEPDLILHPPTSSPDLHPGIDPEDPHSITRLHVDYLGQDEIILITCDDGDVIGYRTEEIQRVLDKRAESSDDDQGFQIEDPVRTFLHRNVGDSAWGLAIHREARMIAISANTHKVTVIAYALAQETESLNESCSSSDSDMEGCPEEEDPADFPYPRRQDHVITLCARHNIPAVSFNNSGDDPAGRWLSSSSINGEASIWDLHQPWEPVRVIKLGFCASVRDPTKAPRFFGPGVCDCLRPSNCPHAVWSTMFLDASTAYERTAAEDAAWEPQHLAPCFQVVNKDKGRFKIKPRKMIYPAVVIPPNDAAPDAESSEMNVSETESNVSSDSEAYPSPMPEDSDMEQQVQTETELNAHDEDSVTDVPSQETLADHANAEEMSSDAMQETGFSALETELPPPIASNAINAFGVWFQPPGQHTPTIILEDSDSDLDEMFIPSTAQAHIAFAHAIQPMRAYCEVYTNPVCFEVQVCRDTIDKSNLQLTPTASNHLSPTRRHKRRRIPIPTPPRPQRRLLGPRRRDPTPAPPRRTQHPLALHPRLARPALLHDANLRTRRLHRRLPQRPRRHLQPDKTKP